MADNTATPKVPAPSRPAMVKKATTANGMRMGLKKMRRGVARTAVTVVPVMANPPNNSSKPPIASRVTSPSI